MKKHSKKAANEWLRSLRWLRSGTTISVLAITIFAGAGAMYVFNSRAATSGWLSGASCNGVADGQFAGWRGSPVTVATTWNDSEPAVQDEQWSMSSGGEYGSWTESVDDAIGGFWSGSWGDVANGSYDSHLRTALQNINAGWGSKKIVFIRFAHEFNGNWYPWKVTPDQNENFKTAFAHFYDLVQQELVSKGRNAKVVWSPNSDEHNNQNTAQSWPGDSKVDVVGVDYYDWARVTNESEWLSDGQKDGAFGGPYGIYTWQDFARQHGKPLSFPEWGESGDGGDDNPFFIQRMNQFFRENAGTGAGQVWYEAYFNCNWDNNAFELWPNTAVPNAAAKYKSLSWGDGGVVSPPPTTPPPTTPPPTTPPPTTPPPATTGEVSQTGNILAGKTFSSSVADSSSETGHPASYMTDGNGSTRWISQPQSPVNLSVDMGGTYTLNKVSIKWAGDTIHNYQLQISKDNSSWSTFYTGSTNNQQTEYHDYTTFSSTPNGRYLRIVGTDRWDSSYGNSIFEVGAYGSAAANDTTKPVVSLTAPPPGASLKGAVAVSGTASDNVGVTKVELVVDGGIKATNNGSSANFSWNSSQVGDGQHTMFLRAYDSAGNQGTSATITVSVANTTAPAVPTVTAFTATPATVTAGGRSTLTWSTKNASKCSVNPGGPQDTASTVWQTPALTSTGTKTYTLDCQNSAGQHVTKTVSVAVSAAPTPPSKPVFTASATTIQKGGSVTLYWSSAGATSCTLNPGNIVSTASSSKIFTNLQSDTTYNLSCKNNAGSTSADPITVRATSTAPTTVPDPVIVSFTATPDKVSSGQYTTLAWAATGVMAGGCTVVPTPLSATVANGTWRSPALTASTSYTLTCANTKGKTVSKSVSVSVDNTPVPAAPAAGTPTTNLTTDTSSKITARNGQPITNGAVASQISGLVTLDPSNVTDSAKEQTIVKVEYYDGENLIQTDTAAPFALDTTKLKNGQYTITERTYFNDGSQSEVTKVIDIANSIQVANKKSSSGPGAAIAVIMIILLIGGAVGIFWFVRRRGMQQAEYGDYGTYDTSEDFFQQYGSVAAPQNQNPGPYDYTQYGQQQPWQQQQQPQQGYGPAPDQPSPGQYPPNDPNLPR